MVCPRGLARPATDLDGVKDELLAAVLAGLGAFGTFGHGVLGQESPHHSRSALVLAVDALLWTDALVVLRNKKCKDECVSMVFYCLNHPLHYVTPALIGERRLKMVI